MRQLMAVLTAILLSAADAPQQLQRLSPPDASPVVSGVLEVPDTAGTHPGLILLPGSFGWRPAYAELARQFARAGFVTLAIDYYAETGRVDTEEETRRLWPRWEANVRAAAEVLRKSPAVGDRTIGLVGFSQGASLAVSASPSIKGVGAVVAFFGGSIATDFAHVPPLLILQGDADTDVPVSNAYRLCDAVVAQGGEVEMHIYPGAGHGFNVRGTPGFSEEAAADGWRSTEEFLHRKLGR